VWVAVGFPLLLIALLATPLATDFFFVMIGLPFLLSAWAILGVWAAFLTFRSLRQRNWRRAITSFILPLVILGVGLRLIGFVHFCANAGDTVHFYLRRPAYVRVVRATQPDGNALLVTINLGGMSWASRGFVYDESDEIMRNPSAQSAAWKARAQYSELGCGYDAMPIPGPSAFTRHWYIASFAC
jgi:hypothetical protein